VAENANAITRAAMNTRMPVVLACVHLPGLSGVLCV